jgi:hypothetical protein
MCTPRLRFSRMRRRKSPLFKQLGNLLALCREIGGTCDILQKFENLILHFYAGNQGN